MAISKMKCNQWTITQIFETMIYLIEVLTGVSNDTALCLCEHLRFVGGDGELSDKINYMAFTFYWNFSPSYSSIMYCLARHLIK